MKTDDLIRTLSRDLEPSARKRLTPGLVLSLVGGLIAGAVLVVLALGLREHFMTHTAAVAMKAIFSALVCVALLPLAARLARPGRRVSVWLIAVAALLILTGIVAGFMVMPGPQGGGAFGYGFPLAYLVIPVLATPTAILVFGWFRRHAPTRLAFAGGVVGAMSGGLGAVAYALICPVDDMGFVSFWYGAAILTCTVVGAVIGPRILRW
ncbi:MAG: DUF1109 domain-containing protein [Hyphomonadaceae bacterium]